MAPVISFKVEHGSTCMQMPGSLMVAKNPTAAATYGQQHDVAQTGVKEHGHREPGHRGPARKSAAAHHPHSIPGDASHQPGQTDVSLKQSAGESKQAAHSRSDGGLDHAAGSHAAPNPYSASKHASPDVDEASQEGHPGTGHALSRQEAKHAGSKEERHVHSEGGGHGEEAGAARLADAIGKVHHDSHEHTHQGSSTHTQGQAQHNRRASTMPVQGSLHQHEGSSQEHHDATQPRKHDDHAHSSDQPHHTTAGGHGVHTHDSHPNSRHQPDSSQHASTSHAQDVGVLHEGRPGGGRHLDHSDSRARGSSHKDEHTQGRPGMHTKSHGDREHENGHAAAGSAGGPQQQEPGQPHSPAQQLVQNMRPGNQGHTSKQAGIHQEGSHHGSSHLKEGHSKEPGHAHKEAAAHAREAAPVAPNMLRVTCTPQDAGTYQVQIVLSSPADVRVMVIEMVARRALQPLSLVLESPARQRMTQEVCACPCCCSCPLCPPDRSAGQS